LVRKCERNRPFGNYRNRRNDDIKMNLKKIRWECIEWIQLDQDVDLIRRQRNFRFHKIQETSSSVDVLPSQKELCSMNFVIQLADTSHYAYFAASNPILSV
jgi:hypothetical protein